MKARFPAFASTVLLLATSLSYRCANQMSPVGGPRDTIPPVLLQSQPVSKSTGVNTRTFTFIYNERISADKIQNQLIITPRIVSKYNYRVKKNTLRIDFDESFADSTTYTFNFREGVGDITEGNPPVDNKFTFSTGDYIDSLRISGYATYLLSADTAKNVTVGLYRSMDTVNIFNGSPYYFTNTDDKGFFLLENLKEGLYSIYAFRDNNKNLKLEPNTEAFGFLADTINLTQNIDTVQLNLLNVDPRPIRLQTATPSGRYFHVNYNKYIARYDIIEPGEDGEVYSNFTEDHRTVRFYNTQSLTDSLRVIITAVDSIDQVRTDTVYVKFRESTRRPDEFTYTVTPRSGTPIESAISASIKFSKPVIALNRDSIAVVFDTTAISHFNVDSSVTRGPTHDEIILKAAVDRALADTLFAVRTRREQALADSIRKEMGSGEERQTTPGARRQQEGDRASTTLRKINRGLALFLGQAAFISAESDSSATSYTNYEFFDPEKFSLLEGKIQSDYPCYFVQLIDNSKKVIHEIYSQPNYRFNMIPPGKYKIRFLIDANCDGKWNPGNLNTHIEPEPVYFFPDEIIMRANWEMKKDLSF